jgi:hypothetical protein
VDGPTLRSDSSGGLGATNPTSVAGMAYIFMMRSMCTSGRAVQIRSVTADAPTGGMKVVSWGIRHRHADEGESPIEVLRSGAVSQLPDFGNSPVTARCGDMTSVDRFAVSVSRSAPKVGTMKGIWITYGPDFAR